MERNYLEDAQRYWLKKKMAEKMKKKTMKKEEEKAPLEVTEFFCSLVSNLSRREHTLYYRPVVT